MPDMHHAHFNNADDADTGFVNCPLFQGRIIRPLVIPKTDCQIGPPQLQMATLLCLRATYNCC